jgi:hypothetical protein
MHSRLHTIWITTLTLVALLLSSAVTSAPLMPLQMLANNQMAMTSDAHDSHCMSTNTTTAQPSESECCGSDSMSTEHQCCTSSCIASNTALTEPVSALPNIQPYRLVLITSEVIRRSSAIANALFRPPIV